MATKNPSSKALLKEWEKSGKAEFIKSCELAKENFDSTAICKIDVRKSVYQLVKLAISQALPISDAVNIIKDGTNSDPKLISLFADVISVVDTETSCLDDKRKREQFLLFLSSVTAAIPKAVLKCRLDPETLESAQFIPSQLQLNQKLVRTKTKLFYKQQKYNLLREESEGYAKLITELLQDGISNSDKSHVLEIIMAYIGYFNLDPNRALDILLEAFECKVDEDLFFIPLLCSYLEHCDVSGFSHLIGFKFQFYHQSVDSITPAALYKLAACLLRNDLLQVDALYPHLQPSDNEIEELNKKKEEASKEEARKLNTMILSEQTEEDEKGLDRKDDDLYVDNQKFGLCHALLELGAWEHAVAVMNHLPLNLLMSVPKVCKSLCHLVHCTIEPLYRSKFSPKAAVGNIYRTSRGFPQPCLQYSQLCDYIFPMLSKLGPHISIDPVLMVKIIRVAKGFLKEYNSSSEIIQDEMKSVFAGVLTFIDEVLFPALSLLEYNCCVAEELWGLVKRLPYTIRYRLYSLWKNRSYNLNPRLVVTKARTMKRAKYITKRLSKENVKFSGRQIGKLGHSNPTILFDHILDQIQRYDNFIGPMVDALKYLTPLGYDVMAFCVIESLADPNKERMKQSDTNISDWLQSLSQFCGAVFKKYATEITGLLQYIANQLKAGKSLDLLVLKEVVQKMSGVEASDEITKPQLEALAGGELLKAECAYFGQIRNTRKPSMRLRDALMEGQLTIPLCLLIAQQRNAIVYVEEQKRHLKLIGKLYDECQDNLIQFGGFLTLQLSTHDYKASLPTLDEFHEVYGITPDVSFFLTRPVYRFEIQEKILSLKQSLPQEGELVPKHKQLDLNKKFCETCDNIFRPVVESSISLQASRIWNNLSPLLYVTFWSLSMYDVYTPEERYDEETRKIKISIDEIDDNKEITSASKKRKEKERCQVLVEKMASEKKVQIEHNKLIQVWLESRKDAWFPSKLAKGETITQFLQLCIFPRCVFSAVDAVYCAKFIQTIHELKAPNFSTLICFDRTFSDVSYIVASLTENEASRYGRFLCAMLEMVMRWHGDKELYDTECAKYPGFLTILRATNSEKASYLDYENFRHVCYKWQYKLTKALILGIESKDYTQIRNTLLILIKIIPYYPQIQCLGAVLERRIEKIISDEKGKRHDLQALAVGYNGLLKARKSSMVPENVFHIKDKDVPNPKELSKSLKLDVLTKTNSSNSNSSSKPSSSASSSKPDIVEIIDKTKPVKIKEEKETSKASHGSSEKRTTQRTEGSYNTGSSSSATGRSEREKVLIDDSLERKSSSSRSPKGHHSSSNTEKIEKSSSSEVKSEKDKDKKDRSRERERERSKEREKEKDKRSRTSSPLLEDIKKRKTTNDSFQSASSSSSKKDKDKPSNKNNERKRTSVEMDSKDSKRRKDETSSSSSSSKGKSKKDK